LQEQALEYRYQKLRNKSNVSYQTEDGIIRFVDEVLRVPKIYDYQEDILRALVREHKVAVRGPHGLGKTAIAAWLVLWLMSAFNTDTKVPTTASTWAQLIHFLWPEIKKWARRADWNKVGMQIRSGKELLETQIKVQDKEAFALASNRHENIEGAHASVMGYVLDEAKTIPAGTWDAVEGAFSTAGSDTDDLVFCLAISTPGPASGRFYEIHKRAPGYEDWTTIHVTLQQALAAGAISQDWVDARRRQWGVKSGVYKNRVLGEFDTSGEHSLIPLEWIEASHERWHACGGDGYHDYDEDDEKQEKPLRTLGVDVARFGEDKTAIADKVGEVVEEIYYTAKQDTMQTTGHVVNLVDTEVPVGVDVIGMGAGVVDRLAEMEYNVIGVNVAKSTKAKDRSGLVGFKNLRSQLWWMMRELLDPANDATLALPPDDRLTGDLTAPTYGYTSTGLIIVESKDDMRKRIGRSTDSADAVMLAVYVSLFFAGDYEVSFF